jgi:membrane-bound ClpP family serine protease
MIRIEDYSLSAQFDGQRRDAMITFYWICLVTGVLFTVVTLLLGEVIGHWLGGLFHGASAGIGHSLHVLQPVSLVGGITALGACGLLLTQYTGWPAAVVLILSALTAVGLSVAVAFFYVRPMQNSENSTGFSIKDLHGAVGEITVPIPSGGYGEVVMKVGAGRTNQIAASFDGAPVPEGSRVVVVESKDGVLYVSPLEKDSFL